ncbi:MAG: TRAP transporter large permease [Dehalococcoidia bacterium]|nr:TRAP transporter large permease [Dehalococcoidia bacterium]
MDSLTIGIIGCVALIVLLFVGVPVAFALCAVGFVGIAAVIGWGKSISMFTTVPFSQTSAYTMTPMPLFVLMASLTFAGGLSAGLYDAAAKWLVKLKGGLGIATTIACTLFGTLTGSALVTAAMFTKVSVPEMRKHGYDSSFAHGLTCASSVIGMLIPPSIIAILYGVLAEESIAKLFMAGIGPGLLTAVGFSLLIYFKVKKDPGLAPLAEDVFTWKEKFSSLANIWPMILIAVVMLGGIFTGMFTVTEGGAIGAFSTLIVLIAMKKMNWGVAKWASLDTVKTNAMIFLLLIGATVFSRFITITGVTSKFVALITESGIPEMGVMASLMLMYLVLGCFLDPTSQLCITLPLVLPIAKSFGWDPIYFAMLVIYMMHIATVTPPVGLTLFATKGAADPDISFVDISRGTIPFIFVMVGIMVILVFCEPLTIGLARWM